MQRAFSLSGFELDALLIALAPEIDLRYQRLYAYLQDDVRRRRPSVDLVLNLLCPTVEAKLEARCFFGPRAKLVENRLLRVGSNDSESTTPLLARELQVEDAVVSFLVGQPELDDRLRHFCAFQNSDSVDGVTGPLTQAAIRLAEQSLASGRPVRLYFQGPRGSGRREAANALARSLNLGLLGADLGLAGTHADLPLAASLLCRDARLLGAMLYLDGVDTPLKAETASSLDPVITGVLEAPGVAVLAGNAPWASLQQQQAKAFGSSVVSVRFGLPDFVERVECWQASLECESGRGSSVHRAPRIGHLRARGCAWCETSPWDWRRR
jgi:hypothetical protein